MVFDARAPGSAASAAAGSAQAGMICTIQLGPVCVKPHTHSPVSSLQLPWMLQPAGHGCLGMPASLGLLMLPPSQARITSNRWKRIEERLVLFIRMKVVRTTCWRDTMAMTTLVNSSVRQQAVCQRGLAKCDQVGIPRQPALETGSIIGPASGEQPQKT